MTRAALLLTTLLAASPPADAQSKKAWATATLPATPAFLAAEVGWKPAHIDRVAFARDLVRLIYMRGADDRREAMQFRAVIDLFAELERRVQAASVRGRVVLAPNDRTARDRLDDLLNFLGYDLNVSKQQVNVVIARREGSAERRDLFRRAGIDVEVFIAELTSGSEANLVVPSFEVPLPLSIEQWGGLLGREVTPRSLVGRILSKRESAFAYCGLLSLDPETLEYVSTHQALLESLVTSHSGALCAFGRSIHVRANQVATPGDGRDVTLWQELAAASPQAPGAFIIGLLSGDGGRAAWFFDLVMQAPAPTRNFILRAWDSDARRRHRRALEAYAWFQAVRPGWQPDRRPFERPVPDPTLTLLSWRVEASGQPAGPASRRFWGAALGGDRVQTGDARSDDDVLDAAALLDLVRIDQGERERLQALAIGQSIALREPGSLPATIGFIVSAYLRLPLLVRTLERMPGVRAETMSMAIRQADVLTDAGGAGAYANLTQFQSLLAIIDAAASMGDHDVNSLVAGLSAVPLGRDGVYEAALTAWVARGLLPAVRERVALDEQPRPGPHEATIRAWLAGRTVGRAMPELAWEGFKYRADPSTARLVLLSTVRDQQRQPTLDALLQLHSLASSLTEKTSQADAQEVSAALKRLAAVVDTGIADVADAPGDPTIAEELEDSANDLARARGRGAPRRFAETGRRLLFVTDRVATRVFRAIAYAPHIGTSAAVMLMAGDVGSRHDLGLGDSASRRPAVAWLAATFEPGTGSGFHLRGSLLGLGPALAPLGSREAVDATAARKEPLSAQDQFGLVAVAMQFRPVDVAWTSDALDRIAAALAKGRGALPSTSWEPGRPWEWRYHAATWAGAHESDALPALRSFSEILAAGTTDEEWQQLGAFGSESTTLRGSWRPTLPAHSAPEIWLGRESTGIPLIWATELKLRVAELMEELRLPGILAPALAPKVAALVLTEARPTDEFDWAVLQHGLARLTAPTLSDLVAGLTADGTLTVVQ